MGFTSSSRFTALIISVVHRVCHRFAEGAEIFLDSRVDKMALMLRDWGELFIDNRLFGENSFPISKSLCLVSFLDDGIATVELCRGSRGEGAVHTTTERIVIGESAYIAANW